MNNYCTNCGEKLKRKDYKCNICNTPVVDIKKKISYKKVLIILLYIVSGILIFISILFAIKLYKYYNYESFVEKELEKKYNEEFSNMELVSTSSCYNCFDPVMGCDGGAVNCSVRKKCNVYKYEITSEKYNQKYPIYIFIKNKKITIKEDINLVKEMYDVINYLKYKANLIFDNITFELKYESDQYDYIDDINYGSSNQRINLKVKENYEDDYQIFLNNFSSIPNKLKELSSYIDIYINYSNSYSVYISRNEIIVKNKDVIIEKWDSYAT